MTDIVDQYLEHFGVKGMRWGVRNDDDGTGRPTTGESARLIRGEIDKLEKDIDGIEIAKNHDSYKNARETVTTEASEMRQRRLTPTQKKVIVAAALLVSAVALVVVANKVGVSREFMSREHFSLADPRATAGKTFEKGHQFFRQSSTVETSMRKRTYAFSDIKDVGSFRGKNNVVITAKEAIRMASGVEVRDALSEIVNKKDFVRDRKTFTSKLAALTMTKQGIANAKLTSLHASWFKSAEAEKLLDYLSGKGYGAMVDPIMGGSAHILFGDLFEIATR